MYLNPQDKQHNFTEFVFLSGVVCQAKATTPIHDTQNTTWIVELNESNLFTVDFAFSCFRRLELLGYRYPDKNAPGGIIEWVNNGVLCTLSWIPLDKKSSIKIIYSEDSENPEVVKLFCI